METIFAIIVSALLGLLLFGLIGGLVYDFHYFSKLSEAVEQKDENKIKEICTNDWYSKSDIKSLPAACLKYYQK